MLQFTLVGLKMPSDTQELAETKDKLRNAYEQFVPRLDDDLKEEVENRLSKL